MRRMTRVVLALLALGWLADLEWRLRMQRAGLGGLRTEMNSKLAEHQEAPHAAYLMGEFPRIDPPADLGLADPYQAGRVGAFQGVPVLLHDGRGARIDLPITGP
jgi:hypothetical protein